MAESSLEPTRRAVIDVGRICNLRCSFCYYHHEDPVPFVPLDVLKLGIVTAKSRGNSCIDFTGGEPTMHPNIVDLVEFCSKIGLKSCIITNATLLLKNGLLGKLTKAGLSDFLVSIQGRKEAHNRSVCAQTFEKVEAVLDSLRDRAPFFRTNTVMTMDTYKDLPHLAAFLAERAPKISNFINFNARYGWIRVEASKIQAKCSEVAPYLKEAIEILEAAGVGVNVRYFPFCLLKGFEKNVCNAPFVLFDPYEWDYGYLPKNFIRYTQAGEEISAVINAGGRSEKCRSCGAKTICGTVDRPYFERFGDGELEPYEQRIDDPSFFRRHNKPVTLKRDY